VTVSVIGEVMVGFQRFAVFALDTVSLIIVHGSHGLLCLKHKKKKSS
jgi:hypothetical protein